MDMSGMGTSLGPRGCMPPTMFRPGYNASDLRPESCAETVAPLLKIPASASLGWLALHLVNAGSTTKLTVSLDSHTMFVYAADGLFVNMQEVEVRLTKGEISHMTSLTIQVLPINIGERYSVMVRLDQKPGDYYLRFAATPVGDMQQVLEDAAVVQYERSVHESDMTAMELSPKPSENQTLWTLDGDTNGVNMLLNGSAKTAASILRSQNLAPFDRNPPPRHTNVTKSFNISQTGIVSWVVDRYAYSEPKRPVIYGNASDGWSANTTLHMPFNASIDLIMRIAPDSMDTVCLDVGLHSVASIC